MLDILYLSICSILSNSFIRSKKVSLLCFPKSPILTPVKTTSFFPSFSNSFAFKIVFSIVSLLLLPLAKGIAQ